MSITFILWMKMVDIQYFFSIVICWCWWNDAAIYTVYIILFLFILYNQHFSKKKKKLFDIVQWMWYNLRVYIVTKNERQKDFEWNGTIQNDCWQWSERMRESNASNINIHFWHLMCSSFIPFEGISAHFFYTKNRQS